MSRVSVLGLGYIGLPTAAMLAREGHTVSGYDTDSAVIERIEQGKIDRTEPELDEFVSQALESGRLSVGTEIHPATYHVICVPTPFDAMDRRAELSHVEAASKSVASELRRGDTVILESTVPPGTTRKTVRPILEESGMSAGEEFSLAYSPETVLPGNILAELCENDRIVGGVTPDSTRAVVDLYETFIKGELHLTDSTTAEFAKLIQNTFRDTNIALSNEFAKIADDYGIDVREAIQLGNTHPRVTIHRPGPGVGGHCLPVDPWFLSQETDRAELIERGREINDEMVDYVINLLQTQLDDLSGRYIAVLGVAYKGNVSDTRQSPTLRLAERLTNFSPNVTFHDPHVQETIVDLSSLTETVRDADAMVVMTDHDEYSDLEPLKIADLMRNQKVVDTKGMLNPKKWSAAGFDLSRI